MIKNPEMITIHLEKIKLVSPLGWWDEERRLGTKVSISCSYQTNFNSNNLSEIVDYAEVHSLIVSICNSSHKLLEELANEIASQIITEFKLIAEVEIIVSKLNPPLTPPMNSFSVQVFKTR